MTKLGFLRRLAISIRRIAALTGLVGGILFRIAAVAGKVFVGGAGALLATVFDGLVGVGRLSAHEVGRIE